MAFKAKKDTLVPSRVAAPSTGASGVEGRLAHAELAAHVADRRPALGLPQHTGHLLHGKRRPLHRHPSLSGDGLRSEPTLVLNL